MMLVPAWVMLVPAWVMLVHACATGLVQKEKPQPVQLLAHLPGPGAGTAGTSWSCGGLSNEGLTPLF